MGFSGVFAPQRSRSVALCALPKEAEGSWGDVDPSSYPRKYVVGGNWKSNGDYEFATTFPEDVLNKVEFNKDNVEVVVSPTYIHLGCVKEKLNGNVQVSA